MNLPQIEADQLFELKKYQADGIIVNFPIQGEDIMIELQNDTGRIKFMADINNANEIVRKATFQVRYQKIFILRRLDLNGNHKNPPDQTPDVMFEGFENYVFNREDHIHFYFEGYGERWALPLSSFPEIGITLQDDLYDKVQKFFKYCNVEELKIRRVLEL